MYHGSKMFNSSKTDTETPELKRVIIYGNIFSDCSSSELLTFLVVLVCSSDCPPAGTFEFPTVVTGATLHSPILPRGRRYPIGGLGGCYVKIH